MDEADRLADELLPAWPHLRFAVAAALREKNAEIARLRSVIEAIQPILKSKPLSPEERASINEFFMSNKTTLGNTDNGCPTCGRDRYQPAGTACKPGEHYGATL